MIQDLSPVDKAHQREPKHRYYAAFEAVALGLDLQSGEGDFPIVLCPIVRTSHLPVGTKLPTPLRVHLILTYVLSESSSGLRSVGSSRTANIQSFYCFGFALRNSFRNLSVPSTTTSLILPRASAAGTMSGYWPRVRERSQFSLAANALSGATQLSPTIIDRPSLSGKDDFGSCG